MDRCPLPPTLRPHTNAACGGRACVCDPAVAVAVPEGSVGIKTVRGLLTSVSTGRGDVNVEHIEGNLRVDNGVAGSVSLGKIMGEDIQVATSGAVRIRALYAKRLDLSAAGGCDASVLSAEEGMLLLGGDSSNVNSAEGVLNLTHQGPGELVVQASEQLRSLTIQAAHDGSDGVTAEAPNATGGAAGASGGDRSRLTVHLPEGMAARAELVVGTLKLDERLTAVPVERGAADVGRVCRGPPELSTTGTRVLEGSSASATPWWSAAARRGWSTASSLATVPGCRSYLLAGATNEGEGCEISVLAAGSDVELGVQSWFEQRLKTATLRSPQPYR